MPPTASDQHVNALLTGLSVGWANAPGAFVVPQVFPAINVQKQTDDFATYDRGDFLRDEMAPRGPYDTAPIGDYKVGTDSYHAKEWSLGKLVSDQERANADAPFNPDRDAAKYLTEKALIRWESLWVEKYLAAGVWTGGDQSTLDANAANGDVPQWSDVSSTPIEFVENDMADMEVETGLLPNTLVLNRRVWNALKNHPDVIDRVRGGATTASPAKVTREQVAALLEVDKILVASAVKNNAQEGEAPSMDYIVPNHALLVYAAPSPGLFVPSGGYTFRWTGLSSGNSQDGLNIMTFRDDDRRSDRHEINAAWDVKLVAPLVGRLTRNLV